MKPILVYYVEVGHLENPTTLSVDDYVQSRPELKSLESSYHIIKIPVRYGTSRVEIMPFSAI